MAWFELGKFRSAAMGPGAPASRLQQKANQVLTSWFAEGGPWNLELYNNWSKLSYTNMKSFEARTNNILRCVGGKEERERTYRISTSTLLNINVRNDWGSRGPPAPQPECHWTPLLDQLHEHAPFCEFGATWENLEQVFFEEGMPQLLAQLVLNVAASLSKYTATVVACLHFLATPARQSHLARTIILSLST